MPRFADLLASLRRARPLAVTLTWLCVAVAAATAQTPGDIVADDPLTRVARLSYVAGDLGLLPAGASDWSDASLNRPLTGGDRLSTGDGARAELELGGAALRIGARTDAGLLELNDQLGQIELTQGTLNLSVRQLDDGQSYEIDTPDVALVIDRPGSFRVDVGSNGAGTRIAVLDGQATVYGENDAQRDVFGGRSYRFEGPGLQSVAVSDIGGGDAFDSWCGERDRRYAQSTSGQYVSGDVVGYQDLDAYGDWQTVDDYGAVWFPRQVDAGWAPYRNGHWAWIGPWGWTWIDDSPWGFAPYHYGRWAYVRNAWGWVPGPIAVRPVYAPALVAFVGGGGWNVSIGIGSAPVGWFPLGPRDIYNPWYRASRGYYQRVNLSNIRWRDRHRIDRDIDDHYRHFRGGPPPVRAMGAGHDRRGYTVVPGRVFAGGKHVPQARLRVDARKLAAAPVLTHGTTLRPEAGALARPRNPRARPLPVAGNRRQVVARHVPSTPLPARTSTRTASHPATAPQGKPFANVRPLSRRPDARPAAAPHPRGTARDKSSATPRPLPSRALPAATPMRNAGKPAQNTSQPVRGAAPGHDGLPVVPRIRPAQRAGELASSRYAHPSATGRDMPRRNLAQPRTATRTPPVRAGAAPRDDNTRPRTGHRTTPSTLPQVPRFRHATPNRTDARSPATKPFRSATGTAPSRPRAAPRPMPRTVPQPVRAAPATRAPSPRAAPRQAPQQRATSTQGQRSSGKGRALPKPLKQSQKNDHRR